MPSSIAASDFLQKVRTLNVWRRGDERAPHKPLLLLLALGLVTKNSERLTRYADIEKPLRSLLTQFGAPRRTQHPEYPFWRLQTDGVWEVQACAALKQRLSNTDPLKSELVRHDVRGGFPEPVWNLLRCEPKLITRAAETLLENSFPSSIHDDILREVGLQAPSIGHRPRDGKFQGDVLRAYGHRCAVCAYDVKVGSADLGLEGAHIKWHQAGGPDDISNGLALCTVHHRALDRGAIGVTEESVVLLSSDLHGSSIRQWFEPYKGKKLYSPSRSEWFPRREYLGWHLRQVFRGPAVD